MLPIRCGRRGIAGGGECALNVRRVFTAALPLFAWGGLSFAPASLMLSGVFLASSVVVGVVDYHWDGDDAKKGKDGKTIPATDPDPRRRFTRPLLLLSLAGLVGSVLSWFGAVFGLMLSWWVPLALLGVPTLWLWAVVIFGWGGDAEARDVDAAPEPKPRQVRANTRSQEGTVKFGAGVEIGSDEPALEPEAEKVAVYRDRYNDVNVFLVEEEPETLPEKLLAAWPAGRDDTHLGDLAEWIGLDDPDEIKSAARAAGITVARVVARPFAGGTPTGKLGLTRAQVEEWALLEAAETAPEGV